MEDELGRELGMEEDAEEEYAGKVEAQREEFVASAENSSDPSGLLDFVELHVRLAPAWERLLSFAGSSLGAVKRLRACLLCAEH